MYSDNIDSPGDATSVKAVHCTNALYQRLPPSYYYGSCERLNLLHQIPELGVVVAGDQKGRIALLTLTAWPRSTHDSRKKPSSLDPSSRYGFKISSILPRRSEEREKLRPDEALIGVAVGPVQGQGTNTTTTYTGEVGSRRYRLLMTYTCHTVLSYEIYREFPGGNLLII